MLDMSAFPINNNMYGQGSSLISLTGLVTGPVELDGTANGGLAGSASIVQFPVVVDSDSQDKPAVVSPIYVTLNIPTEDTAALDKLKAAAADANAGKPSGLNLTIVYLRASANNTYTQPEHVVLPNAVISGLMKAPAATYSATTAAPKYTTYTFSAAALSDNANSPVHVEVNGTSQNVTKLSFFSNFM
ncbi:MAG: hypothetical protein K5Q00_04430 [Gammaproteobacteria bacterium]|nr:hypothetical protein [Gammaproteobacteria bacterium]